MGAIENINKLLGVAGSNPATLNSVNGISVDDKPINAAARSIISSAANIQTPTLGISKEDYISEIEKNNIVLNPFITEEDLQKQRAKNQSWFEQGFNSIAQLVGGEIALGTLQGFTNLYDVLATVAKEIASGGENTNDFTSQASLFFEEKKDELKERLAIYRENPNQSWDVGDFAWWADNFVSVGSTLSLLIPSVATTKGLSALGRMSKGINLGRTASKAAKAQAARAFNGASGFSKNIAKKLYEKGWTKSSKELAGKIDAGASITSNALLQRTLENWQESREVYKLTYDDALNKLSQLNDDERAELISRNPEFVNKDGTSKSDDQIAQLIAEKGAYNTFWNDYALLMFDIMQFASIPSMYRGLANRHANANLRIANENLKRNLRTAKGAATKNGVELTETGKSILAGTTDKSIKNNIWNRVKTAAKDPFNTFLTLQLTEGIEEGYQAITTERGQEVADMIFDPNTNRRSLDSYLQDGHVWEQAFWGVVGAWAFGGAGKALARAERKIKEKQLKGKLSDTDFAKATLSDEKLRELEIIGRIDKLNDYKEKLDLIEQGKDPSNPKRKEALTDEEKELYKRKYTSDFITDIVLEAADNGNFELLNDFLTSQEFSEFARENGISDLLAPTDGNSIGSQMNKIYEQYKDDLYTALEYSDDSNPWVANILARHTTRNKLTIEDIQNQINEITSNVDINQYDTKTKQELKYLRDYLKRAGLERMAIEELFNKKAIGKEAYAKYSEDNIKELKAVFGEIIDINSLKYADWSSMITAISDKLDEYENNISSTLSTENADKTIIESADKVVALENAIRKRTAILPKTNEYWKNAFSEIEDTVTKVGREKYKNASSRLKKYIGEHSNPKLAYQQLLNSENVYEGALEDLELIKIGHTDTALWWSQLSDLADAEIADRAEQARRENQPTDNNEPGDNGSTKAAVENLNQNAAPAENPPTETPPAQPEPATTQPESIRVDTGDDVVTLSQDEEVALRRAATAEENEPADVGNVTGVTERDETIPNNVDKTISDQATVNNKTIARLRTLSNKAYLNLYSVVFDNRDNTYREYLNTADITSDGFRIVYNLIADEIELIGVEISEQEKEKVIYSVIDKFLDKLIVRYKSNPNEQYSKLKTKLITNKLLSAIALVGDEIGAKDELMFNEVKQFIKETYGLSRVGVNTRRTINVIDFFNWLANKYNAGFNELADFYRFINEYIDTGIHKVSFSMTETFRYGFEEFLEDWVRIESIENSDINESSFVIGEEFSQLDEDVKADFIYKIAVGKAKPKLYIEQSSEYYEIEDNYGETHERLEYPSVLSIYYIDEKGTKQRLGYIPKARYAGSDNSRLLNMTGYGFNFEFSADGKFCIFDKLIETLYEKLDDTTSSYYKLYDELIEYAKNPEKYQFKGLTSDILEIPEIKELIERVGGSEFITSPLTDQYLGEKDQTFPAHANGGIAIKAGTKKLDVVENIIANLYNLIKDFKGDISAESMLNSYENYRAVRYQHMLNNIDMQNKLAQGIEITADIGISGINIEPNKSDKVNGISELISVDELNDHPIVLSDSLVSAKDERGNEKRISAQRFNGRLNLVLYDYGAHSVVVPLNRNTLRASGSTIVDDVKEELRNIIRDFLESKSSYEDITQRLIDLLQGNRFNKLFSGIKVKQYQGWTIVQSYNSSRRTIRDNEGNDIENADFGSYILGFNKNAKNEENKEDRYLMSHSDNSKNAFGRRKYDKQFVEHVVNKIVDELSFNQSRFMFDSVGEENAKLNKHVYKENGKFVVEIGGNKRVYNSYSEFIVKENTVSAKIEKGEDGLIFKVKPSKSYSLLNIQETVQRKVENAEGKIIKTIDELYEELKAGNITNISTSSLLEIAGVDSEIINILLGDKTGIPLIDSEVTYDETNDAFGAYDSSTGKTEIGNKIFARSTTADAQKNRNLDLVRTLIHEKLHRLFAENEESDYIAKRKKELIDTLVAFRNAITNDKSDSQSVKNIRSAFTKFLDNIIVENGVIKNQDGSTMEQSDQLNIIEEWLVESLTQPVLANYLNNTKYENADVTSIKENKSIFQKIIDVIIKLFNKFFGKNFGEIKNNTIFAKQYLILSDKLNAAPTSKEEKQFTVNTKKKRTRKKKEELPNLFTEQEGVTSNEPSADSPVGEESQPEPVTEPEGNEDEDLDLDDIFDDAQDALDALKNKGGKLLSDIPLVIDENATSEENIITEAQFNTTSNPNGVIKVNSMPQFVREFSVDIQPKIAILIDTGKIKYLC